MIKTYEAYKKEINSEKWVYGEDTIYSIFILQIAKSMVCVNKLIYIYKSNNDSIMSNQGSALRIHDLFKYERVYRTVLKNKKYRKYIIGHIKEFTKYLNNNRNLFSGLKSEFDIKNTLINLLKTYSQYDYVPNDIIYNFAKLVVSY